MTNMTHKTIVVKRKKFNEGRSAGEEDKSFAINKLHPAGSLLSDLAAQYCIDKDDDANMRIDIVDRIRYN